jgi:hypothetical protein
MDGAVHAAASRQRRVGRVHNGIRRYARDVAFFEDDLSPRTTHPAHTYLLQLIYD